MQEYAMIENLHDNMNKQENVQENMQNTRKTCKRCSKIFRKNYFEYATKYMLETVKHFKDTWSKGHAQCPKHVINLSKNMQVKLQVWKKGKKMQAAKFTWIHEWKYATNLLNKSEKYLQPIMLGWPGKNTTDHVGVTRVASQAAWPLSSTLGWACQWGTFPGRQGRHGITATAAGHQAIVILGKVQRAGGLPSRPRQLWSAQCLAHAAVTRSVLSLQLWHR
jgi:hypothetical protein